VPEASGSRLRPLAAGELVLLHDRSGRRYRVVLKSGGSTSLHTGALAHDDLLGQPDGSLVTTARGAVLLALRPTFAESVVERRRQAQPIYPKDLGAILVFADLFPGARVLETGTGTGALTIAALRAVGAAGSVVSIELREEFLEAARETVADALGGMPANLDLRLGDAYQDPGERELDRVLLDLPEPWNAVPWVRAALVPGGIVFAHCPNVSQVQKFGEALRAAGGFGLVESFELLQRGWTIRGRSMRPAHRMVAHTGFLTFARRLAGDKFFESEGEGFA
jgi:tRNA (adenine57-N1/adenine58-N1)-methyltransferase catalytic subunit